MSTDRPTATRTQAYTLVLEAGEDVTLRRKVAAAIMQSPATTPELAERLPHSKNAIRPRVDELLRMECVEREGTRENDSGHESYVHHITDTGEAYVRCDVDPDPKPRLSELQGKVVDIARAVVRGEADDEFLRMAVQRHDSVKRERDPEWEGGV